MFYFSDCIFQLPSPSLPLIFPHYTLTDCFIVSFCQSFLCILFFPILSSTTFLSVTIFLISILHFLYLHPVFAEGGKWPLTAALMEACVCVNVCVLRGVILSDSDRVDKVTSR